MRLRVKAVAAPLEAAPEPAAEAAQSSEPARIIRRVKTANGGFLERLDFDATQYEPLSVETLAMPPVQPSRRSRRTSSRSTPTRSKRRWRISACAATCSTPIPAPW